MLFFKVELISCTDKCRSVVPLTVSRQPDCKPVLDDQISLPDMVLIYKKKCNKTVGVMLHMI